MSAQNPSRRRLTQTGACIFDLYGTLVDIHTDENQPSLWRRMAGFAASQGARYEAEELRQAYLRLAAAEEARLTARDRDVPNACPEIDPSRKTLSEVPVVPAQSFIACARALHFTIHKKALATVDIHFQTELLREENGPKETASRSWIDYELLHGQEELLLQCVRDGNLNYKKVLAGLNFSVLDLPLAGNPLRSEANKVASGGALFRRAAIEGGLSPKVALDLENQYLFRADKLRTVTELRSLTIEMLEDFIRHVHEAKQQGACSRQIRECCEYIDNHLTEDLSVQRIAKEIGYTEYYLTRKFQKEMKIRMSEYIKDARLEYAKVCLLSTQMSIEEIGDLLQFNSRSYFTKTFREKTGKSPSEYRAGKEGGA